jgi:hypothetical protein
MKNRKEHIMEITFETNGKAFIGWIIELPGAYIRGKTIVEAKERIDDEITSYQQWLDLPLRKEIITHENIFQSKSTIEDVDSDILLGYDINDYNGIENLKTDCENALLSAKKFDGIYKKCNHKNIVDKIWVGKTFFGELPSTIEKHLEHILDTQKWYLNNIEADMDSGMDIINGRIK